MSVTAYKNVNYGGAFMALGPGFYSGQDLVGCKHSSSSCEELDNATNSLRVDQGIVVAFAASMAITASGGGARVLVGPAEVPDLARLGMSNQISSILVLPHRAYDSAMPRSDSVTISDGYAFGGRSTRLRRGDYSAERLRTDEINVRSVASLSVEAHTLAILYSGPDFNSDADAVVVVGPTRLDDLDRLGMSGRVGSIRVLYSDPFDTPGRPVLPHGTARDYTPGGLGPYMGAPSVWRFGTGWYDPAAGAVGSHDWPRGWPSARPNWPRGWLGAHRVRSDVRADVRATLPASMGYESARGQRALQAPHMRAPNPLWLLAAMLLLILVLVCASALGRSPRSSPRSSNIEPLTHFIRDTTPRVAL
jgi:hypothetical protein